MISIEHLTVDFSGTPLFEDITFLINPKEKVALVGKNGAGKTTMLRMIAGEQQPTAGIISMPKGFTIGYLPQHLLVKDNRTVRDEAMTAFSDIFSIQNNIKQLENELAERTDYESESYAQLIDKLTHENERLVMMGSNNMEGEMEKTLMGLGFERSDFDRDTSEFSGGWRMRIELAKILLKKPDLLLLDEPTNHLDIESIQWLEDFLKTSNSALLLVSHDRAFLDNVTTRTIEISLGRIYDYKAPYTRYMELRAERREQQIRAYENQQKMIADTEDFIERFRYKATKAVQVQSRIKQLEKLERLEVDMEDNSSLHMKFPPAPHSGVMPISMEHVTKAYGDHVVFENIAMEINRGEKVAFVGKNGEGKSTMVKCILGEIPFDGQLKIGYGVKIAYFAQNQAALLDDNLTVFETIDHVAVGDIRTQIRNILGAFMFGGEASDKKVKVLSGGERSRLAMIRLLLEPANLLILDEPTNHLDMRSKDVLKGAIKAFDGTVILVSHDRDFLDGLVEKVYEFGHKKVREHLGGIKDFLAYKKMESLEELQTQKTQIKEEKTIEETVPTDNKLSYEQQKEQNKKIRKAERQVADAEAGISKLEAEIAQMEKQFAGGESSAEAVQTYQKAKHTLEQKMYEWELLGEELEQLKSE